VTVRFGIGEKY